MVQRGWLLVAAVFLLITLWSALVAVADIKQTLTAAATAVAVLVV
jgi:hypothetical protein